MNLRNDSVEIPLNATAANIVSERNLLLLSLFVTTHRGHHSAANAVSERNLLLYRVLSFV
jgi:hypothetical protein